MRNTFRAAILALALLLPTQPAFADGMLISWSPRDVPGVTEESFNAAMLRDVQTILQSNLAVGSWADAFLVMVGADSHKEDSSLLKGLIIQIIDKSEVRLKATKRLIIWERITRGEILFEGKGYQVSDDLFTVAGRANWMLRMTTGKNFGYVRPNTTAEELVALREQWTRWLRGEPVEEYQDQYPASEKGLDEIRSYEALEALIVSLNPSDEKEWLTKDCLNRLYKLDKLPDDPNSPANLCNPDAYTHGYLTVLTGVTDRHDHAWWKSWWDTNKSGLRWNRELGRFDVGR